MTALAAAAGKEFELFVGRDTGIEIRGGGGERDLRKTIAVDGKKLDILKLGGRRLYERPLKQVDFIDCKAPTGLELGTY